MMNRALRHGFLLVVLLVQSALLFTRLDLLPIWPDEAFTLETVRKSPAEIIEVARKDVHPPLYFLLLHYWTWTSIEGLRAFSGFWALAATLLLDRLWVRHWRPRRRCWLLAMFAFSPCLLLYGRMARSYTMQMALAMLAVYFLWQWRKRGQGVLLACFAWLLLAYTHYAPAMAILGGFGILSFWQKGFVKTTALLGAMLLGYLPWLWAFADVATRWTQAGGFASRYMISGAAWSEQVLKLGYAMTSLTIGETFPIPVLVVAPFYGWFALGGVIRFVRRGGLGGFAANICVAALIGYLGVSRWVSYPFVPARLLWLLPFLCLAVMVGLGRRRIWLAAVPLLSSAVSIFCYFQRDPFLNKAYVAPVREIGAILGRQANPRDLIVGDAYNADNGTIHFYLPNHLRVHLVLPETQTWILAMAEAAPTVWVVRNTRDVSPAQLTSRTVDAVCKGRTVESRLFLPYAGWERWLLERFSGKPAPTHFYELLSCDALPASQTVEPGR